MKRYLFRLVSLILALTLAMSTITACDFSKNPSEEEEEEEREVITPASLNGIPLESYFIVFDSDAPDYNKRAAEYISNEIYELTGLDLKVVDDGSDTHAHEIVVGETNRAISDRLNEDTEGVEFAILAEDGHIALEGDYFVIAAAAYYFVYTYITDEAVDITIPEYPVIHDPIVEEAKSFILLIGDGMGEMQTKLFDVMDVATEGDLAYSDGEDLFYGYLLPYMAEVGTRSLTGVTDSAAAATALASGYKTLNQKIGKDKDLNDVMSITELCGSLGMATAVMSTEKKSGATPASFSAHSEDRDNTEEIVASQIETMTNYGTIVKAGYDFYTPAKVSVIENYIVETLNTLNKDEDGFFLMYEEAHIDKHCANGEIGKAFNAVVRFNQAIGRFMEFCFYNPDTLLIITADHETGDLHIDENGDWVFTSDDHTDRNVCLFAWGDGAEIFDGQLIENVQIPKTIVSMWGESLAADTDDQYPVLK